MAINYNELEQALKSMNERSSKLFQVIKAEMKRRGHWKQLPRGSQEQISKHKFKKPE